MRKGIYMLAFFTSTLLAKAQYNQVLYDKADSLCTLIDEDSTAKNYSFEVIAYKKGFLPIKKKFNVQSKNNFITKIECSYSEFSTDTNNIYGNYHAQSLYFYYGTLMRFDEAEGFHFPDTSIKNYKKRIEENYPDVFWTLHITLFKDEIAHTYSDGHGMTETDEFNLENHYRHIVYTRKMEIKTKYPNLK
jgi:hypothetical protein